jgi:hypothetical protein
MFSVVADPRLYNGDIRQLDRIERVFGVSSCRRELKDSLEVAVG